MINFENARKPVAELIENSLSSFSAEKPDVTWSAFALYACPWSGWVASYFDTEPNSARIVAQFSANGPDWYGEDEWGRFNNNCPDFEFGEWRFLGRPDWQSAYEETKPICVRDLSGADHLIDSDEALNGLTCLFLQTVFSDQLALMTRRSIFPKGQYRFGVQLLDSRFVEFWRRPDVRA
jgi:hypothetical protein